MWTGESCECQGGFGTFLDGLGWEEMKERNQTFGLVLET
jgi:hypothetical protein